MDTMKITALLLAAFPVLAHSSGFRLDSAGAAAVSSVEVAAPGDPGVRRKGPAGWTVMIYMNGKSNLEPFALRDMNRLETVGSTEKVNIVVELGRSKGLENDTDAEGDWSGVRRYLVARDADMERINSPVLRDIGASDMGDWREAAKFVRWAREAYPAKRYMFIVWDHGWGWLDPLKPGENLAGGAKSISHDFETGNYIKTTEIGKILEEAGRVDLYASVACFMQMGEVAYELRGLADVIVGSEEVVMFPTFNFEDFLAALAADPDADAERAGTLLADTYIEMYSRPEHSAMLAEYKFGAHLSAIRGPALEGFAERAGKWAKAVLKNGDDAALRAARRDVLRFEVGDEVTDPQKLISFYADIHHFTSLYEAAMDGSRPAAPAAAAAGRDLRDWIDSELVVRNVFLGKDRTGKDFSATRGIALNIPGLKGDLLPYHRSYGELAFEKASDWGDLVEYMENLE
ncbi:MAG TPA: clostripain-related cysteine peptidase [Elusimicrobiales bacterium]|nr:clostripain-related cysteine peptidase [Elusimicrobiales bacterium]